MIKTSIMKAVKSILLILLCFFSTQAFCQYTEVINSNRPGVSRSAFSVGTNVLQFEAGPYILEEERTPAQAYKVSGFGADFAIRYGLIWEQLELNVEGTYQRDDKSFISNLSNKDKRANFKYLSVGAKFLIFDPYKDPDYFKPNLHSWKANRGIKWKHLIPAVSVYAGANFDAKDNPYTAEGIEGISPKVMIATQNNLPGGWVFVMNLIKDRIGTEQSDFQYILTLTHAFSPKWVVFGETQGIKSDFYADNLFRFGGAYLWSKNFQLDTALTFNTKDTPSVFSVNFGMSYRLDFHKDKEIENETSIENQNSFKTVTTSKSKKVKNKRSKKNAEALPKKQKRKAIDF